MDSIPVGRQIAALAGDEGSSKIIVHALNFNDRPALVFENDAKVKVKLIKLDDSDNPLPGAVFNIIKDGQIVGTEAEAVTVTVPPPLIVA